MEGYQYSNGKLLSHYDILGSHMPIYMVVGVTCKCDMRCGFCIYYRHDETTTFRGGDELDPCLVADILREFAVGGGKAVNFSGGGEPLLYPHLEYIVGVTEGLGLEWGLITNGTRLDRMVGHPIWVRVSINAGSEDTWHIVTGTTRCWDKYIGSITNFVGSCRESGTTIGSSFITYYDNYLDIVDFTAMCRDMGMEYVRLTYAEMNEGLPLSDTQLVVANQLFTEAEALATDDFTVVAQRDRWDEVHDTGHMGMTRCYYAEHAPFIGGDGWLYPCCQLSYREEYRIRDMTEDIRFHVSMDPQNCPPCTQNQVNYDMGQLIGMRTSCMHRNFI